MAFILRLAAFAWLVFGGVGSLAAGPYDKAWSIVFLGGVIFPVVVLFWLADWCISQQRIDEMEQAIRRSKGG